MSIIKTIIVEDEKPARDLIRNYMEGVPNLELIGEYDNGFDGLKAINEFKPDVIFLDVQMPKLTGFEMLEVLEHHPEVIFTTAYDQYAIQAFEQNAADYLLKPFSRERFKEAIGKLEARIDTKPAESGIEKIRQHLIEGLDSILIISSGKDYFRMVFQHFQHLKPGQFGHLDIQEYNIRLKLIDRF